MFLKRTKCESHMNLKFLLRGQHFNFSPTNTIWIYETYAECLLAIHNEHNSYL